MGEDGKLKKFLEADQFFGNLFEFISDCSDQSTAELKSELEREGIDINKVIKNAKQIVNRKLTEERLDWQERARERRESILNKVSTMASAIKGELSKSQLIDRIRELSQTTNSDVSLAYRNLEEMTEDDLRDALKELEILTALENQESQEDENGK